MWKKNPVEIGKTKATSEESKVKAKGQVHKGKKQPLDQNVPADVLPSRDELAQKADVALKAGQGEKGHIPAIDSNRLDADEIKGGQKEKELTQPLPAIDSNRLDADEIKGGQNEKEFTQPLDANEPDVSSPHSAGQETIEDQDSKPGHKSIGKYFNNANAQPVEPDAKKSLVPSPDAVSRKAKAALQKSTVEISDQDILVDNPTEKESMLKEAALIDRAKLDQEVWLDKFDDRQRLNVEEPDVSSPHSAGQETIEDQDSKPEHKSIGKHFNNANAQPVEPDAKKSLVPSPDAASRQAKAALQKSTVEISDQDILVDNPTEKESMLKEAALIDRAKPDQDAWLDKFDDRQRLNVEEPDVSGPHSAGQETIEDQDSKPGHKSMGKYFNNANAQPVEPDAKKSLVPSREEVSRKAKAALQKSTVEISDQDILVDNPTEKESMLKEAALIDRAKPDQDAWLDKTEKPSNNEQIERRFDDREL